jgi:membrane fusion protein (multidrug efflux system)
MKKYILILFTGLVLLGSCENQPTGELETLKTRRDSLKDVLVSLEKRIEELDTAHAAAPALVSVESIERGTFNHFIEIQGMVEADRNVTITAEIPALIKRIHVKEGQRVKKGTLLVTLDDETTSMQVQELETQLELANYVFEKQANLRKENIGSELDYEKAKNNKEYLESALETARSQLGKARIRATFDGVVDEVFPKEGELTGPQMPLIRFISLGVVNMKVDVPESYLDKIKLGDPVEVNFPDLGKTYESRISQKGNFILPRNRTFKVSIDLPVSDKLLLPNLIGVVKIKDFSVENAMIIKVKDVLQDGQGRNYVFVIEEQDGVSLARKKFVELGRTYKDKALILSGVEITDKVVSNGARSIVDGEQVEVFEAENEAVTLND